VKNSIGNPKNLIASGSFRSKGKAKKKKQLDDFWRIAYENVAMTRLHQMIAQVASTIGLSPSDEVKGGVVAECSFNAVVVADHHYAGHALFEGYQFVTPEVARRFATYVGASSWVGVADGARTSALALCKAKGLI
jgi:hypothetical protein